MRCLIIITLLIIILVPPSYALNQVTIDAEEIYYDKEKNLIQAKGDVKAQYQDLTIEASRLIYENDTNTIITPNDFYLQQNDIKLTGKKLIYSINKKEGKAEEVSIVFNGANLKGKKVTVKQDEIDLSDSTFSTCGFGNPHYRVQAASIIIYPDTGWVVCYWGYFWMGDIPLVPVPTYIYDLRAHEKGKKNAPPFPEVGSNQEDGTYIVERVVWHLSRKLNGTIGISYAEKKGWGTELIGNYLVNDDNFGNIRVNNNAVDQWYGGINHIFTFGEKIIPKITALEGIDLVPYTKNYEFETVISYKERINYEKVSYLPKLVFRSNQSDWLFPNLKFNLETSTGFVTEESSGVGLAQTQLSTKLNYDINLNAYNTITPGISLDYDWYGNNSKWLRPKQLLSFTHNNANFKFGIEHIHYLLIEGVSPFNFENYKFVPFDELNLGILVNLGDSKIGINTAHYLPNFNPKDIDYSFHAGIHCYAIILTYRAMRQEFLFGFEVIPD